MNYTSLNFQIRAIVLIITYTSGLTPEINL